MTLGRKPEKVKTPVISAPPQITQAEFTAPTLDQYQVTRSGNQQQFDAVLSPLTRQTIQSSQEALQSLADELSASDAQRMLDIAGKGLDYYTLQSQGINAEADGIASKAQSDLARRFGGAYNATFGATYLAGLEQNRLAQLSKAAKEATLVAEDLAAQDEESRVRRFALFQNYLTNEQAKAENAWDLGSHLLQDDAARAQNLAITRANLAQNAMRYNQEAQLQVRQQRLELTKALISSAEKAATQGAK
ncbi:MAG: hypothetical protein K0Q50_2754 [Vampirovibrio sp.]|jgi:hypothetical protein|nr:hypothetical protein [Vampirovibrio sp.]